MNDRQPTLSSREDEAPGAERADHHSVYRRALEWVDRHHVDVSGDAKREHEPDLLSTSLAIFLRMHFQTLREVSEQDRMSWGGYLKTFQKVDTGFFTDPCLDTPSTAGGIGAATDDPLTRLVTCFALQALNVLDMPPASELHFMDALDDRRAIEAWLETADWSNAALQAERLQCVLLFLIHRAEHERRPSAFALYHRILDWCEGVQDSKTGFIGVTTDNFPLHSIVATDRLVPFYAYVHRPIQRAARIIDTILSLQGSEDALARSRGSAREALAAVNLLALLGRQSTYHNAEVKNALVRSYSALVAMQRADGSFPDTPSPVPESRLFHHSAPIPDHSVSHDLLSLWTRVLTLTIIEHKYPEAVSAEGRWRFQSWPGLGYHSSSPTLTEHERRVMPRWIRPTAYPHESGVKTDASTPAVSVIVPCYNLGRYLHEAIESVLAQRLRHFEIIVVDDGSTDEYTSLLLDHIDRPNTKIIRQSNQGVAAARNNGIRAGAGRYICCLDADDRLRQSFLAKAVEILDRSPDVGLVSGYLAEFDEREQVVRYDACMLPDLLTYNPVIEPAVFRRKAWEESGGYYSGFSAKGIEDWDLSLTVLERGYRAAVIPEIVWDYRIRFDQMSTKMNQPETWGRLIRELVARHSDSYREHMADAIGMLAVRFAEMRDWAAECRAASLWWERQADNWKRHVNHLERHGGTWEAIAADRGQTVLSQQTRIAELEHQASTSDALAADRGQTVLSQQTRIAELEHQASTSDALAADRGQTVLSQQARIAELEDQLITREAKRLTSRVSRWFAKFSWSKT